MKYYKQDSKGWYCVVGDGNVVIATSKSLDFEFQVTEWKQAGEVFIGTIKKGYV